MFLSDCFGQISIGIQPLNTAGVRGITETLLLQCSIDSLGGDPYLYQWGDSSSVIFQGPDKQDDHEHSELYDLQYPGIDKQWTNYSLVVNTSSLDMAGKYECLGIRATDVRALADILLLGMLFTCSCCQHRCGLPTIMPCILLILFYNTQTHNLYVYRKVRPRMSTCLVTMQQFLVKLDLLGIGHQSWNGVTLIRKVIKLSEIWQSGRSHCKT